MSTSSPVSDYQHGQEPSGEAVMNVLAATDKIAPPASYLRGIPAGQETQRFLVNEAPPLPRRSGEARNQAAKMIREAEEVAGRIISDAHVEAARIVAAAQKWQTPPPDDRMAPISRSLPCSYSYGDELPDGMVVADEAGRVIVFNRAAARLTGLDPAETISKCVSDVLPLHDPSGRNWWAYTNPYHGLSTRTRHPECSLHLADGTEVLVSVGYVRDRDLDHRASRSGTVRRLIICLRSSQQRERLERSRAELVSTVAHELRSPLASIKGFTATLLAKWGRFNDDQKRLMLETVNADADRVTRLITDLLDVSRIESGRMEAHRQLVNLPSRARKIIAGRVAAGDAEDRFRLEVSDSLPETWLDTDKIDQILGNLVENAVRHGAGVVTIAIDPANLDDSRAADTPGRKLSAPDAVAVSVQDQGEGIALDVAPYVFRQFWRNKRQNGTGLGLYIVKGLVEAHGGTICVQRGLEGGAEFRFVVPAGRCPDGLLDG